MPDELKASARDIHEDLVVLRRQNRNRQRLFLGFFAVLAIVAWDNHRSNDSEQRQIRDLACLAVKRIDSGVSTTIDDLRARYDCPAFDPDDAAAPVPGSTTTRTRTEVATKTARPRPGRTVSISSTATATSVRTIRVPGPTVTRTKVRTRTVTRTVTRGPLPCLVGVLC